MGKQNRVALSFGTACENCIVDLWTKIIRIDIQNLKRTALVLTKRERPFYEWLESILPGMIEVDNRETDAYLLPDYEETQQMENWGSRNYDLIFHEQLNDWTIDEDLWIENRTFKMFKEWFDYTLHSMVFDMENGHIEKV